MKSNLKWIIIFAALCLICGFIIVIGGHRSGETAEIIVDGEVVRTVDLSEHGLRHGAGCPGTDGPQGVPGDAGARPDSLH